MSGLLAALCSCAPPPSRPAPPDRLTVRVNLEFEGSFASEPVREGAKAEAAAIWSAYGVDLEWADADISPALCLDAIVDRHGDVQAEGSAAAVLAHTIVASDISPAPIRLAFDAIEGLVGSKSMLLHDQTVATALGRVLAHEVGHVLLGAPAYHDRDGLMRVTFLSNEFDPRSRSRFFLTERSVARLRARIASLSERRPASACVVPAGRD